MSDVRGARTVRMIEDPELGGDLLLVGLALAAREDLGLRTGRLFVDLGRLLWPGSTDDLAGHRVRRAFESDVRTYKPLVGARRCSAPMVRRDGPCGKYATSHGFLTDWATGERAWTAACSRHHGWWERMLRENRAARPESPPLPYANHGGVLVKHFPSYNWVKFWRGLLPGLVEHPERSRPEFQVLAGEGETPAGRGSRPLLVSVPIDSA